MDISSKERLYFDKYLHNRGQAELRVTSPAASSGAVLQNTPTPPHPPLPKSKLTDAAFPKVDLTQPDHFFFFFWVTPTPLHPLISGREDLS